MKIPFEAATNPQKKNTVTNVGSAPLLIAWLVFPIFVLEVNECVAPEFHFPERCKIRRMDNLIGFSSNSFEQVTFNYHQADLLFNRIGGIPKY